MDLSNTIDKTFATTRGFTGVSIVTPHCTSCTPCFPEGGPCHSSCKKLRVGPLARSRERANGFRATTRRTRRRPVQPVSWTGADPQCSRVPRRVRPRTRRRGRSGSARTAPVGLTGNGAPSESNPASAEQRRPERGVSPSRASGRRRRRGRRAS